MIIGQFNPPIINAAKLAIERGYGGETKAAQPPRVIDQPTQVMANPLASPSVAEFAVGPNEGINSYSSNNNNNAVLSATNTNNNNNDAEVAPPLSPPRSPERDENKKEPIVPKESIPPRQFSSSANPSPKVRKSVKGTSGS